MSNTHYNTNWTSQFIDLSYDMFEHYFIRRVYLVFNSILFLDIWNKIKKLQGLEERRLRNWKIDSTSYKQAMIGKFATEKFSAVHTTPSDMNDQNSEEFYQNKLFQKHWWDKKRCSYDPAQLVWNQASW